MKTDGPDRKTIVWIALPDDIVVDAEQATHAKFEKALRPSIYGWPSRC
jgi:hypothetical protein